MAYEKPEIHKKAFEASHTTVFVYCETQISEAKCIEICKSNNPAQRGVMRSKFQKRSALKHADRIILHKHGYKTPQLAAELVSRACPGVYTRDRDSQLIGFGRAISDGAYQAAVYDIAVVPEFQKMNIGRTIMEKLLERLSGCNVILYAMPGKEEFYRKLGLRKMKTGMALFRNPERMKKRGFID